LEGPSRNGKKEAPHVGYQARFLQNAAPQMYNHTNGGQKRFTSEGSPIGLSSCFSERKNASQSSSQSAPVHPKPHETGELRRGQEIKKKGFVRNERVGNTECGEGKIKRTGTKSFCMAGRRKKGVRGPKRAEWGGAKKPQL